MNPPYPKGTEIPRSRSFQIRHNGEVIFTGNRNAALVMMEKLHFHQPEATLKLEYIGKGLMTSAESAGMRVQ